MDTLACNWDTAKFLIFSGNVFDNLIYYSHFSSLIVALIIGVFVFLSDKKALINKVLFFLTLSFATWVYFDMILWATEKPQYVMFFWSILAPVELLFYFSAAYLVYIFIKKRDVSFKIKALSSLFFIPIIIFTHTHYNLSAFDYTNCDLGAFEGILWKYIYAVEILVIICIVGFYIKNLHGMVEGERKKSLLFILGVFLLLLLFSLGNFTLVFELDWKYEQYKLFGMPIFVGLLAYLIVKFKAFNIKLIGAQALVVALVVLIGSQFAFTSFENTTNIILISVTVLIATVMGIYLIKSVKAEVQRKEELQAMSGKLAEANDQLRKLDNAKSEFISIASHQLRTPLTAVKGYISLLLEGSYGPIDPKKQDILNKVYTANERLITLVEDLLNISRIESGRMEFCFAPWQVADICQEVMDTFVPRAKGLGLYLEYKKPEGQLPEVMVDGTKVREVISNLVDNALKYTPKGGVTLKAELSESSNYKNQISNNIQDSNDKIQNISGPVIRVIVSDTGIGVPQTELPYLFAKFSRGKDTSRLNTGGTGLGLYVGRGMIENNGGKIWAESDGQGLGSRFIIEIPVQQSKELMERWG